MIISSSRLEILKIAFEDLERNTCQMDFMPSFIIHFSCMAIFLCFYTNICHFPLSITHYCHLMTLFRAYMMMRFGTHGALQITHAAVTSSLYKYCLHDPRSHRGCSLTHWARDKMAAFSQTTLSNALSWMKILEYRFKFRWSLFLRVLLTIFQHWFW